MGHLEKTGMNFNLMVTW